MELEEALEKILTGNCTLFTGAGFSYGAKNVQNKNLLIGGELTNLLYGKCDIKEHDNDLKGAAEIFLDAFGTQKLIELVQQEFTVKEITDQHFLMGTIPWKRIYTTNYDSILEQAFHKAGKLLAPVTLSDHINEYKDFRKLCVHLNGFIDRLTPTTLNQEFKLTNSSYLTTEFINSTWVDLFRSDIVTSDVIVFIGFSTTGDIDISRILAEKLNSINEKCFFIVAPNENELNVRKLLKFGQPVKIGLNGFAEKIAKKKETFLPPKQIEYSYKSFTEVSEPIGIPKLTDIDFHNLVLFGNSKWELVYNSIINPEKYPYFIYRGKIDEIIEKIEEGETNFILHSGLGNGKTSLLNGLAAYATQKGYKVFQFDKYFDVTNAEVEKICTPDNATIIIIENYSNHLKLIEWLNKFRKRNVVLILSERTIINDTVYYTVEEILGATFTTIDANYLEHNEIVALSKMLTSYGLWGKYSKDSMDTKIRRIKDDFKSTLRLTLLDVLKSTDIQERLIKLIDPLKSNKPFYDAALLIIASKILDFKLELEELVYLLDDELLNNPTFYNNSQLKEIIDFNSKKITINSPILSEGILHTNNYNQDLIPLLIKVVKKLDKNRFNRNNYNMLKSIISHSRLQRLFNTKTQNNFRKLVIEFFEGVKNLNYSRENPFFWLQYAIAMLDVREYKVADQFFNTAYSFAEKIGNKHEEEFDTFQIDNHYSRHLLENEIYNGSVETCMQQFLKAHNILNNREDQNTNRHYPFKVARNYRKIYEQYFSKFNEQDKRIFLVSCQEILRRVDEYNNVVRENDRHRSVKECFEDLTNILLKERSLLN